MCESCRYRRATRVVIVAGEEFKVCQPCDLAAVQRERRARYNPDNARATAERRHALTLVWSTSC